MKTLQEIYHIAEQENITVDHFALFNREALSISDADGSCYIALDSDKLQNETDERSKLAHELGHCITGAFYNQYSNYDCRQKHENKADKWAIKQLIPLNELDEAVAAGHTEIWELAEHFGVTEDLARKAICYYVYGNLATKLYF
ncbi:MAG: ImmA/IrrE family metallo-endopeptidase [Ruminococcaceae bacterium]|nr:ImmA/IrrE family metallo-endopeptidase [Oscillospiraceae bacterium]